MNEQQAAALRRLTLILDALVLPVSMLVAFNVHAALRPFLPLLRDPPQPEDYAVLLYLVAPLWLVLIFLLGQHRLFERPLGLFELGVELGKLHLLGFLGLTGVLFLSRGILNRAIIFAFLGVNFSLMFVLRAAISARVRSTYLRGETRSAWLLVGHSGEGLSAFVRNAGAEAWPPRVLGVLSPDEATVQGAPPRLGAPADLPKFLHEQHVDLVVFFPPLHHPEAAGELVHACERLGVTAAFAVDVLNRYSIAPRVMSLAGTPLISFDWVPQRPGALALKHAVDFILALLLLVALSPLLLVSALAVRASMGAPVLFSQQRVGLHGRRFRLYKLRTMVAGAEAQRAELTAQNEMSGPVFKMTEDPRVTPLGRFLRRWSIDELPQLLNVVLGSMSLVGPRPLPEAEQQDIVGWYRRRLSMKPGITGLWQVSGRSDVDFDDWMKLDLQYVDQWSLRLDARILLRTLPAVLSRRGAR